MNKKKIAVFSLSSIVIVAVVLGLVFFFMDLKKVDAIPESVQITPYEDDFMLWTNINSEYSYVFKVEQRDGEGNFVLIDTKRSDINAVKLSEFSNVRFAMGECYRFSVCYAHNKTCGKDSDWLVWTMS